MSKLTITDQRLKPIADKVLAGERLTFEDGVTLYRSPICWRLGGWRITFARSDTGMSRTLTSIGTLIRPMFCVAHCKLVAFGRDPSAPGAYTFALEEIYQRAEQGCSRRRHGIFTLSAALHPDLSFDYFLELIGGLKQRFRERALESVHHGRSGLFSPALRSSRCGHAAKDERSRRGFVAGRRR